MKKKRMGDLLIERGTLDQGELDRALAIQQEKNGRLGEVLMQNLHVSKQEVATVIEQIRGVAYVECPPEDVAPEALTLIPRAIAIRCCALPLEIRDNTLIIAMAEPQDLSLVDELRFRAGKQIAPRFSFREDIVASIRKFYEEGDTDETSFPTGAVVVDTDDIPELDLGEEKVFAELEFVVASSREESREAMKELQAGSRQRTVAVRVVSMILGRAALRQASDVHIEPRVDGTVVRLRVDGVLRELLKIPPSHQASVLSRIKILSDMDITERRLPQDGRFLMIHRGRRLDVRVATLPTYFGEKIVMRILDPRSNRIAFGQLGLSQQCDDSLKRILSLPQGMLIVTGPTGSGKSTTLYAALNVVSSPGRNVITIEDPVEYMLDSVNQVQVNARVGLTFASCLRQILRQDPNVIMVGEIRDGETAEIALHASQTGHLVLSTLHTNDSIGVITRLRDLGIPSYLISSVSAVVGQRLIRTLCKCRKESVATKPYIQSLETMGFRLPVRKMYQPVGCAECENSGYKGRLGIYEVLMIDGMIRDAIHSEARSEEIRRTLKSIGFRSMQVDALERVATGLTTLEEVMRVVPVDTAEDVENCVECARELVPGYNFCPFCGLSARAEQTILRS
jgi:type IV pilus assembly protein PilB